MKVIVDASVVVAALMKAGRARHVLLHSDATFYVPARIFEETMRAADRIAERAGVSSEAVHAALTVLLGRLEVIPEALLGPHMATARRTAEAAVAPEDTAYIAAALALDAPVWTYDHDFRRAEGISVIGTTDVERA